MAGNNSPLPATFLLTRNAAMDLRRIHARRAEVVSAQRLRADSLALPSLPAATRLSMYPRVDLGNANLMVWRLMTRSLMA